MFCCFGCKTTLFQGYFQEILHFFEDGFGKSYTFSRVQIANCYIFSRIESIKYLPFYVSMRFETYRYCVPHVYGLAAVATGGEAWQ